jgi:hypothetical protein
MADLEYKIKTTVDRKGFEEAKKGLDDTGKAAGAAGKAFKETGDATENLTHKKRDLIAQLKVLRHELPGVGEAIHLLRHPITAVAVAGSFAIEAFKKWSEAVQAAAVKSYELSRAVKPIEDFSAGALEAAIHAEEFARSLGRIGEDAGKAADNLRKLTEQEELQNKLEDERKSAAQQFEESGVKMAMAKGLSPVQGDRQLAAIRLKYANQADADRLARMDRGIALKRKAAEGTTAEVATAQGAYTAQQALVAGLATEADIKAQLRERITGSDTARLSQIQTEKTETVAAKANRFRMAGLQTMEFAASTAQGRLAEDVVAKETARLDKHLQELESEEKFIEERQARIKKEAVVDAKATEVANKELALLETKLNALTEQQNKLNREVNEAQTARTMTAGTLAVTGPLRARTVANEDGAKEIEMGTAAAVHYSQIRQQLNQTRQHGGVEDELLRVRQEEDRKLKDLGVNLNATLEEMLRQIKGIRNQVHNVQ